ncbi:xyloglucan galactosyltransferase KATAMARI1 homolog [Silene latifolia]|uniref:xyloglucan galactosyltransferase KATAMARI1 homolog n=1 Tax=Silene latifolia TaxID=37657 RepID=UPI003D77078E
MINRKPRRDPLQVKKSAMGICRSKFWVIVMSLFTIWLVLICLNYTSLIKSVASLAKYYVYYLDYVEPVHVISNPNYNINTNYTINNDQININNNENVQEEILDKKTEEKTGEKEDEEIDRLLNVNIYDLIDHEHEHDQPSEENTKTKVVPNEITQQNPIPKKRKRKGKPKRRRPKNLPSMQQGSFESNPRQELNNTVEGNVNLSPPPPVSPPPPPSPPPLPPRKCVTERTYDEKSCSGRYVYIHTLPRRFNLDLLRDCKSLDLWMDMCQYVRNFGLGLSLPNSDRVFSEHGWFATNQFLLEVIFHNRMKQYDCLTTDSSKASAIFVPFYTGLDVARHLWNTDSNVRDSSGFELVKLLKRKPEWKRWSGRDHFFVAGRITWDFRRSANSKDPDWGTKFLYLPEVKNMTGLVIESSPWNNNDFGIPYPTYFHPANDDEVFQWQNRMRRQKRKKLFCFAGAPRPDRPDSIRNQLINQCEKSRKCMMIHCNNWKNKCHKPAELMKTFQNAKFCLQPPGDSYTRRSTFDSILAGCIPVFFHPGSAYIQYLWHFPREFTKYSVFISMYDIRDGKVSIQTVLENIPLQKVVEMREQIIKLIPKIVYADPRCRLETLEDAFDLTIKGVLDRVERIKDDMKAGKSDSFKYDETQSWKYRWLGKLEEHEWDPYFSVSFDTRNFTNF